MFILIADGWTWFLNSTLGAMLWLRLLILTSHLSVVLFHLVLAAILFCWYSAPALGCFLLQYCLPVMLSPLVFCAMGVPCLSSASVVIFALVALIFGRYPRLLGIWERLRAAGDLSWDLERTGWSPIIGPEVGAILAAWLAPVIVLSFALTQTVFAPALLLGGLLASVLLASSSSAFSLRHPWGY